MAKNLPAVFGDHKALTRGEHDELFSECEWMCAVYLWRATGQRGGPVQLLFLTDDGEIDGDAISMLREILAAAEAHVLRRPLSYDLTLSAAGSTILEHAKKAGLPYLRSYDSGVVVFRGTQRLGFVESDVAMPRIPRLGDLAPLRSAHAKLVSLAAGSGPLRFERVDVATAT